MFFTSDAHAQENDTQPVSNPVTTATAIPSSDGVVPVPPEQQFSSIFLPLLLIFCVFYFLLIRPQHKKIKAHTQMLNSLKRGDKVVTSGGIIGTVTKLDTNAKTAEIEIASGVTVQVLKHTVTELVDHSPIAKEAEKKNSKSPKKK